MTPRRILLLLAAALVAAVCGLALAVARSLPETQW